MSPPNLSRPRSRAASCWEIGTSGGLRNALNRSLCVASLFENAPPEYGTQPTKIIFDLTKISKVRCARHLIKHLASKVLP